MVLCESPPPTALEHAHERSLTASTPAEPSGFFKPGVRVAPLAQLFRFSLSEPAASVAPCRSRDSGPVSVGIQTRSRAIGRTTGPNETNDCSPLALPGTHRWACGAKPSGKSSPLRVMRASWKVRQTLQKAPLRSAVASGTTGPLARSELFVSQLSRPLFAKCRFERKYVLRNMFSGR